MTDPTQNQPGEPQSFFGTIEQNDGETAPEGTELFALIDGEVEDSISVQPAGQYGGSETFDEKLVVNTGAGDEVEFRVFSPTGPQALESPFDLADAENEPQELDLTFSNGTFTLGGTTSPGGEVYINLTANGVSEVELDGLWAGWTIENVNIDGNPQVDRPDRGRTAQLTFSKTTDISGIVTLSVGDASKYISGEYVLTATINSTEGTNSEDFSIVIE